MHILIDECLDWRLGRAMAGHTFASVAGMGWQSIKNGKLLALAEQNKFDVFLTGDRNLSFQQNVTQYKFSVVVLEAEGTRLEQTLPLIPKVLAVLSSLIPGQVIRVS